MDERGEEAVDIVGVPEDRRRTVEDRIGTLYHIAKTLQLIAETEPDWGREDIVSGPLRFLSRSLWTEISDLHRWPRRAPARSMPHVLRRRSGRLSLRTVRPDSCFLARQRVRGSVWLAPRVDTRI